MTAYEKGQGIVAELVLQDPENPKYLQSLARIQYNLGFVYQELGRTADAETALQGTLETLEREPGQEQRSRSLRQLSVKAMNNSRGCTTLPGGLQKPKKRRSRRHS